VAVLVTGASGFVGSALIPHLLAKGHRVYALSRHPPEAADNLIPVVGDITKRNLGLIEMKPLKDITTAYHIAGLLKLGEDKDGKIWTTNVDGTRNVIDFCVKHDIPQLLFTSTAYTMGRNCYERSKALCELMLSECDFPEVTIFKPSVIMGSEKFPYPGHLSQFASLVIRVHRRAEIIRRRLEGDLRLPIIEPVLRVRGNPKGKLNLVPIDTVVDAMARVCDGKIHYLTNPHPPTLGELIQWIGEVTKVNIKMLPEEFKPTPIEAAFQKMSAAFSPYLWGDSFRSNLKECPPIAREFIHDTIKRNLD